MDTLRRRLGSSRSGLALAAAWLSALAVAPSPAALVAQVPASNVPSADSLRHVTPLVTFVFGGTVRSLGTVENPTLTASARTARVVVDRVLSCPREVGDYTGEVVTVNFMPSVTLPAEKSRAIFFASGWSVGNSIAVNARYAYVPANRFAEDTLLGNYLHAIHLDSTAALQAQVRAANLSAVIRVDSTALLPQPLHRPGVEVYHRRWALVYATVDSAIPASAAWAARPLTILVPLHAAYTEMYVRVIRPNDQLLALLHLASNNPLARVIAPTATFFVPESDNLRPVHDVTMIGGAQPRGLFNSTPLGLCRTDVLVKQ